MAGSARIPHLERGLSGLFLWRRRWPRQAMPAADATSPSSAFLRFSLRTDLPGDAKILARRLTALSDPVFAAVTGKTMPIDRASAELILTDLVRFEIAASDRARALAPYRPLDVAEAEARREAALQATLRQALFQRDREVARAPLREVARRLGLTLDEADHDWQALAMEATRVLLDVSEERARRDRGEFDGPSPVFRSAMRQRDGSPPPALPTPSAVSTAPAAPQPWFGAADHAGAGSPPSPYLLPGPLPAPIAPAPGAEIAVGAADDAAPPPTDGSVRAARAMARRRPPQAISVDDGFATYIAARCAGKAGKAVDETADLIEGESYTRNSKYNVESTRRLLQRYLGDTPASAVTRKDMTEFFSLLQQVPANHGKSPDEAQDLRQLVSTADWQETCAKDAVRAKARAAGLSEGNAEAAAAAERIPRMKVATVYRHMQDTQRAFEYMIVLGHIQTNPMKGVIWNSKKKAGLQALEEDDGRKPWERAHLDALFRSSVYQKPQIDAGTPLFWAPLIAVLGSLREEEALQLLTGDIREIDGVWVFDLCKGPGKRFKTADSIRRVPVHRALIELGLLELVRLRQSQGEVRLFPDLVRGAKRESFSENFTKDFTRYRVSEKIYDAKRDFHALRATFNVALIGARIDSPVRKVLMGHKIADVTWEHYSGEGYDLAHLRDVVNQIDIDVSMIRRPFGEAPAAIPIAAHRPALKVVR